MKLTDLLNVGESISKSFKLDTTDLLKVGRDALLAAAAAGLTVVLDSVTKIDFGVYNAILVPIIYSVLNAAMRYIKSNTETVEPVEPEKKEVK